MTSSTTYSSNTSTNNTSDGFSAVTSITDQTSLQHEELCLILLRGVMERLILQLDPCQHDNNEKDYTSFTTQSKTYTSTQWKDVMQLAQDHSAECAVQIAKLYPQVPELRSKLAKMVVDHPEQYIHLAECVLDYIRYSGDQTKRWLLYWTQPSLTTV